MLIEGFMHPDSDQQPSCSLVVPEWPTCATGYRYVRVGISIRAGGLAVQLNLNPDGACNFSCIYCHVRRQALQSMEAVPDIPLLLSELSDVLERVRRGKASEYPGLKNVPGEYLQLAHVALSGDGEPTLCPRFDEIVEGVLHVRSQGHFGFFKITLLTNGSGLNRSRVRQGVGLLHAQDEVWVKLDAGSNEWFQEVNRPDTSINTIIDGIRTAGEKRDVIVQTLVPRWKGHFLPEAEQEVYIDRIQSLVRCGTRLHHIQIYSVLHPPVEGAATHATLSEMSTFAERVRQATGLSVGVY